MLEQRLRYQQQIALLAQQVAAMPEYPIYHEANGYHCIYIDGRRHLFASEAAARLGQLTARANWLRRQAPPSIARS